MVIASMPVREHVKCSLAWFFLLPKNLIIFLLDFLKNDRSEFLGRRRFLSVTPHNITNQIVYDRHVRKCIGLHARDNVDIEVLKQIFLNHDYGLFKFKRMTELIDLYNKIVSRGNTPLIIDCGANNGMSMRYFSEVFNSSNVVGVEQYLENYSIAQKNTLINKNIIHNAAIGSRKSKALIKNKNSMHWAYMIEEDGGGSLDVITINDMLRVYDLNKYNPYIIKIDIEGYESNLFSENVDWIDLFPIIIIELHDWMLPKQANSSNFLKQISSRNRDFIFYGENVFSISNSF